VFQGDTVTNRSAGFSFACLIVGSATAGMGIPVQAQQVPNAGTILNSTKEPAPPPRPEAEVLDKAKPAEAPGAAPAGGPSVQVKGFRFVGNTVYSAEQLAVLLAPQVGKSLTLDGLNEAADTIRDYYRDHHYFLAQAYLPPQQVADGLVEIRVLEGRIGKVTVTREPSARLLESAASRYLDALTPAGALITEARIEKPLLLTNDLPGVLVRSTLKPGAEPGTADLDVQIGDEGRRFDGNVQIDNLGNRNTGRARALAAVNGRNLTGLGDLLSVRGLIAEHSETKLADANYTLPVGAYGTKATLGYTALQYRLGGTFANQFADGNAQILSLSLQHPIERSRNLNLFAALGYQHKKLEDRLFHGGNIQQHRIDSEYLGLIGDARDGLLGGALNSFDATLTHGKLDNPVGANADAYNTAGTYYKLNANFRRLQNVMPETSLLLAFSAQAASKNLTSAEKLSLGGPDAVRAHPVGEGSGDQVAIATVELRRVVPEIKPFGGTLQFDLFYDAGYSHLNHTPLASDTTVRRLLQGYGLGANFGKQDDFLVKVEMAFRCGERATDDDHDARVWARAIKWF
jgi:hemolysin activation/secretion protein